MPVLDNPKHELFAQQLAKGKSQVEAYAAAGYKPNDGHAARLAGNGRVKARLTELQARVAESVVITAVDIARQLDEDREFAREVKQAGAAVSASLGKAKVLGVIVDKVEHTGADGGPIETKDVTARELVFGRITGLAARGATERDTRRPH